MNDEIITNEHRVAWGRKALDAYSRSIEGGDDLYAGMETESIDLLCDLFHLIYQNELEPLDLIEAAHTHFRIELGLARETDSF